MTVIGWAFDAMEPFIAPDGNAMFFNSLNDGINTGIYFAAKINDSSFSYVGAFPIINQVDTPKLDAVYSMDVNDNLYWVSTREYPAEYENLQHVTLDSLAPLGFKNFGRVHGNFNINSPGWIIMDAAIDHDGNYLYICNAMFSTCGALPCFSKIVMTQKVNDSTFNRVPNTNSLLASVNDTDNYINYAPCITEDGLELYYTRALIAGSETEVLVATRSSTSAAFGTPVIIDNSLGEVPEGPTLTFDKSILYYHKKKGPFYSLFMRYRTGTINEVNEHKNGGTISAFPNPSSGGFDLSIDQVEPGEYELVIWNALGQEAYSSTVEITGNSAMHHVNDVGLKKGVYQVSLSGNAKVFYATITNF